jgi:hypothetical protein
VDHRAGEEMSRLVKLLMLMVAITIFNSYLLHSEELDDKFKEIILNIPDVIKQIDIHKPGRNADFQVLSENEIDLDGNKIPDYIVIARYLDYGGTVLAVIEDMKTPVYWDLSENIDIPVLINNIIPKTDCMFYKTSYSHGFAEWQSKLVGLWVTPRIMFNMSFSSLESSTPAAFTDEDNFKFEDLDRDGLKEIELRHIVWKYKKATDDRLTPVLSKKEISVFKYDNKTMQVLEIKDKKMLEAASKLPYDDERKSKVYDK